MNKPKVSFMIAAMLLLAGVSSCASDAPKPADHESNQQVKQAETSSSNNVYASIPSDEIQHAITEAEFIWDAKDPYYGYNRVPVVARVHIDSIDGGRAFSTISDQYVFPQTIGKMTVRDVYKGDVKPGDQVNYSRVGGTVTFDEYWSSLNQQQRDKILHLNNGQRPTAKKYIQKKVLDDVDIEAGKEYVVFLSPQSSKDGKLHEYSITGYQFGLREVKGSGAETTVLNNETKTWESLDSLVKLP
ncbi:hypothetical protein AU252_14195 [Pseudarthrobacter sulfonivorans]|uniref:Lipoprotein n=1 Tax=Pseudarthrobacter sulfonivorans TaxID=121292 RepID=A0A0U3QCP4_9MICC|nr:hypothetical protein [Pseudarthrobacter sulfonivorans]ALV42157.1 hypothetical protein AU252_14195 [Pseudarthrobacter sulfonivorans]